MDKREPCKVVIVGESGVGKTSLTSRFRFDCFSDEMPSTVGGSYISKDFSTKEFPNKILDLEIWDTAGQEKYRSLTKLFYKEAKIALVVYDITRDETFKEVKEYWIPELRKAIGNDLIIGIAGNKSDRFQEEKVDEASVIEYAKSNNFFFHNTSAKENTGINELFNDVCNRYLEKIGATSRDITESSASIATIRNPNLSLNENNNKKEKKKFC